MSRCTCDLRHRQWNPSTGICQTCRVRYQSDVHDQPAPIAVAGPAIADLITADIAKRDRIGTERYGQRLRAGNGRDALRDAYEEALDLAMYLRQLIQERGQ